jgi:glycosyltransferase involved in cell wall biosynthesis
MDPGDPAEIRHAIVRLVHDPEACRRMREDGRKVAHEKYSWVTEEKKLIRLYEDILQCRCAAAQ